MDNKCEKVVLHPQLLEGLFAHKGEASNIFNDVLGLHDVHHIAVTRIDKDQRILVFSSTAALEFKLFKNQLWTFDKTYNPEWFKVGSLTSWQSLYHQERYDELYYIKQTLYQYSIGVSIATFHDDCNYIYSFATKHTPTTDELFRSHESDFCKIGHYCRNLLIPLFEVYT
jgi:hypothetical protein